MYGTGLIASVGANDLYKVEPLEWFEEVYERGKLSDEEFVVENCCAIPVKACSCLDQMMSACMELVGIWECDMIGWSNFIQENYVYNIDIGMLCVDGCD